jgi:hypothetical protein
MKISKTISTLIVGIAIMGFTSVGMAYNGGGMGYEGYDSGMGYGGYDYEKEETTSETAEEEETVAEAEPEAPPMEEDEYTEEERVVPVAGEGEEEITIPEIY